MKQFILTLRWLYKYAIFFRKAVTANDLHQPVVYQFARWVVEDRRPFYAFFQIRALRKRLLRSREYLALDDHGAGSKISSATRQTIGELARYQALSEKEGIWLFRMVQHFKPQGILELGTSLGLSTLYLKLGARETPLLTIEGSPEPARQALRNLEHLNAGNYHLKVGTFAEALQELRVDDRRFDFFYLDGDHRGEATRDYLSQCRALAGERFVVVLADIYWSADMEQAWKNICRQEDIPLSIDLFHFGVLIFDPYIRIKQHYYLVRRAQKPWRTGIGLFS
ncbi:MAG: class I SAM-dependent methyltransferase [Saprospiraceae bacterium]|jgi:predicted O-methyltransferase YrrM|nr:class I SAM-dependent methyltransferase [Saprospiraceae bacterium]MDP4999172.1 class I SAM-dependent methyltransferase [Saprospiraceae bacterium]